jgi:DNA-binding PadR family transcriptional regulator
MTDWLQYRRKGAAGLTRVRVGRKRRRILLALMTGAANLSGYPLMRLAQCSSGTVYFFLDHLENAGWVTGDWEVLPPGEDRPRRRFYTLTPLGRDEAAKLLGLALDVPVNR